MLLASVVSLAFAAYAGCSSNGAADVVDGGEGIGGDGGGGGGSSGGGGGGGSGGCDTGGLDGGACPLDPGAAAAVTAFNSCADLDASTVSFKNDIRPILYDTKSGKGCTTLGCHGQANPEAGIRFFGEPDGGTPSAAVLAGLVNVPSAENPDLMLVKPGDPKNSYLMHKLDSDQCRFAQTCNKSVKDQPSFEECGHSMPYNRSLLCLDSQTACVQAQATQKAHGDRDQVRRWIAQGAQNN